MGLSRWAPPARGLRAIEEGRAEQQFLATRTSARHAHRRASLRFDRRTRPDAAEADDILRDTLHCFESGTIDDGALTAFNIAIEQFHNAVADRKTLLMSMPQSLQRASAQFRAAGTGVSGSPCNRAVMKSF